MDLFVTEGRGGIIQIVEEPIFPLKSTIEYLQNSYNKKKIEIQKSLQTLTNNLLESTVKVNYSNRVNDTGNSDIEVLVEGKISKNSILSKETIVFKHEFKLKPSTGIHYKC